MVLTVLEKVLKAVVYGEDIAAPAPVKEKKQQQSSESDDQAGQVEDVVVIDPLYVAYAEKNEVDAAWVAEVATEFGISPQEIAGWALEGLVELRNIDV
ncbi:hypothetical protein GCM10022247_04200 [Allokutzneria multivorans]|uniref:Uncharacterized protein n=1 Tax=Allokutzneria multivorans TaxID=1142134 RepID=A0ABP7QVW7_9PSEU